MLKLSDYDFFTIGAKTRTGMIGITGQIENRLCDEIPKEDYTYSIAHEAKKAGKAVGVVTTTRITHASPAGTFGHVAYRDFESDA